MPGSARNVRPVNPSDKPSFSLAPSVAHVWTAHLDTLTDAQLAVLSAPLDADEAARTRRFYFERDRRHFAAARGLLRLLLARYLGTPPASVRFDYGPRGKPGVAWPETRMRFNLSHSHGRALFGFALDREVGIDVEAGARLGDDWPGLARRIFSAREQRELASLPPTSRRAAFLDGWTRKEAYLKATGLGIVDGLQTIEVTLTPEIPPVLLAAPAGLDWSLRDLRNDPGHAAALVIGGTGPFEIQRFDGAALLIAPATP